MATVWGVRAVPGPGVIPMASFWGVSAGVLLLHVRLLLLYLGLAASVHELTDVCMEDGGGDNLGNGGFQ